MKAKRSAAGYRIARQSLPETLAASLRERILNGEFQEGDALIQDAIAMEYDVSRMPVREALRQLEAAGLVAIKVHRGAVVTSLSIEQIEELFELRSLLEGDIVERSIPRLTADQLIQSKAILAELERAYRKRDIANWGQLNWEFHRSLYVAADRTQTLDVIESINVRTDRYIRLQLLLTNELGNAESEHRELLRLCVARDADHAVPYLRAHILSAGRNLVAALEAPRASPLRRAV